ncbi:MAG: TMEM175 family protein [Streptococcaceae bacterium]|nr:TMEM175 family protein [Streptococcaceae bacterium]
MKTKAELKREKRYIQYEEAMKNPKFQKAQEEVNSEFIKEHPHLIHFSDVELQEEIRKHRLSEEKRRKTKFREHIEVFSDAVIAVIITIMLLEIPMPSGPDGYFKFLGAVGIFFVSFIVIGNFWLNHHKIFSITEEVTEGIVVQDFIFLALLSIIPLLTKWIIEEPTRFSALNYGGLLLLILLQQENASLSSARDHFKNMPKTFTMWRRIWAGRLIFTLLVNIIITALVYWSPENGHWLFIVIPVFSFILRLLGNQSQEIEIGLQMNPVMDSSQEDRIRSLQKKNDIIK